MQNECENGIHIANKWMYEFMNERTKQQQQKISKALNITFIFTSLRKSFADS